MRAYRPSRFARDDEYREDVEREKQRNVEIYAERARAGLPLFVDFPTVHMLSGGGGHFAAE